MEILTYKKVYLLVGDNTSGTNECITKSAAVQIAEAHRKNVTSNLSQYLNNEYIDVFAVEDKPDLSTFSFANNRYNPQAAGNTYTTAVSSRDIDGNTIEYNATADVDWITDIVINSTEIRFRVAANIGDQRTGHITGSNATGNSDTITIVQEAKEANLVYTYSLVATCTSVPTVTINGTAITRYTTSGNTYTFLYTTRVRNESEAPESVGFTINGGGAGDTYNEGTLSISPTSWDLKEGLSKLFIVGYSRIKTTKAWDHATGTIARNDSTSVSLTTSTTTEYPTIDYTIRDTHPLGLSFSHSKNGMKFTTTASSVDSTGSISVQYNNLTATANVVCTIVYNTYTYTVKASDTNTSGTPTIIINGRNATITHSEGYYIGKLSITESSTVTAPQNVSWSISGGNKATEWGKYNVSISPNSWNLDDGLTKNFNISMTKSGTKYDWNKTSGTVARDAEVSVAVVSSSTNHTGSSYSITGPSGISFTKNGTNVSATASSTANTGTITVICTDSGASGESDTCNVTYTPALRSWVYTVNASCQEKPTITIGDSDAVITGETNAWVGTVTKLSQEDPGELAYSVTSGSSSKTWGEVHISTNPTSITIDLKPKSITFKAYAYQDYVEHTAKIATGTTSNKRASCKPVSSDVSKTTESCTCSVATSNVSDIPGSMSISKAGTTVNGTASDSGSVTISYSNEGHDASATVNITYNNPDRYFSFRIVAVGKLGYLPTVTINGCEPHRFSSSDNGDGTISYDFLYGFWESDAPDDFIPTVSRIPWSLSGGVPDPEYSGPYSMSVSPSTWLLENIDNNTTNIHINLTLGGKRYYWTETSGYLSPLFFGDSYFEPHLKEENDTRESTKWSAEGPSGQGIILAAREGHKEVIASTANKHASGDIVFKCTEADASGESATCTVIPYSGE